MFLLLVCILCRPLEMYVNVISWFPRNHFLRLESVIHIKIWYISFILQFVYCISSPIIKPWNIIIFFSTYLLWIPILQICMLISMPYLIFSWFYVLTVFSSYSAIFPFNAAECDGLSYFSHNNYKSSLIMKT